VAVCWTPAGVMIKFKNITDHVLTIVACVYPGTTIDDFNWLLAQPSKGKAVWARFYYLPYWISF
jgi:hypothetical protein